MFFLFFIILYLFFRPFSVLYWVFLTLKSSEIKESELIKLCDLDEGLCVDFVLFKSHKLKRLGTTAIDLLCRL